MSALASYLRSHRLKSGFSRRELAEIVGLFNATQVGRHERSNMLPSLMAALSYQAIFQAPIAELFPGLYETITQARGRNAHIIALKLVWLNQRKGSTITDSTE
jgi:DNA-binding XRE family transcriptional regulator